MPTGARVIWIMFGDMTGGENVQEKLLVEYMSYRKTAEKKGITIAAAPNPLSKQMFFSLLAEDATVAFAWHSHGVARPFLTGDMLDATPEKKVISAAAIGQQVISSRLQFAAILGCGGYPSKAQRNEWLNALKFSRFEDAARRLYAFGGIIDSSAMFEFVQGSTLLGSGPYKFRNWLEAIEL